jgi:hypothetical protein
MPKAPEIAYVKKGWTSVGDFLGTGRIACTKRKFLPFKKARNYARSLNCKSSREWKEFVAGKNKKLGKIPSNIPRLPWKTYKKEFVSWKDWLGSKYEATFRRKFAPFRKARKWARKQRLKGQKDWVKFNADVVKGLRIRPSYIPTNPQQVYKDKGWTSFGDWVGTGYVAHRNRKFWPLKKARAYVQRLKLKNSQEWREYSSGKNKTLGLRPEFIPGVPEKKYKQDGWKGMADFLGKDKKR